MASISRLKKIISLTVSIIFLGTALIPLPAVHAQDIFNLPPPGLMVSPAPQFQAALIKGIQIFPDNPLKLDFIIDPCDSGLRGEELKAESSKLIKYFLASLTVPDDDLWVNLSPYEKDRIIADGFGQTEMGRDMLAQDYILKQLTASLIYPETDLGRSFWDRIYEKAQRLYGTTDIPVDTFNKVWIIPDKATVYENGDVAFVTEAHLKVLLESDYLALNENMNTSDSAADPANTTDQGQLNDISAALIKEIILPEIEKEINESEHFAPLRQIYYSMILASWLKRNLRQSLLGDMYVGQNKIVGIDVEDKAVKEKIYQQYLEAFKQGAFNYIKDDFDAETQEIVQRKYFSGGTAFTRLNKEVNGEDAVLRVVRDDQAARSVRPDDSFFRASINLFPESGEERGTLDMGVGNLFLGLRKGTNVLPETLTLAATIQLYETAVHQNNADGIFTSLQQARGLLPNEEVLFLTRVLKINVPDIVTEVAGRMTELFQADATLRTPGITYELEQSSQLWRRYGSPNIVAGIDQAMGAGTDRAIADTDDLIFSLDGLLVNYQDAINQQDFDSILSVLRTAPKLEPPDQVELLMEIATISSSDIVVAVMDQLAQVFSLHFELKTPTVDQQLIRSLSIWESYGAGRVTNKIQRVLEIAHLDGRATDDRMTQEPPFEQRLQEQLELFNERIMRDNSPENVDKSAEKFEAFIRSSLARQTLTADQQSTLSDQASQALMDLRQLAVQYGFVIEQSPKGLSDERFLVVYRIAETAEDTTTQGPVLTFYVEQVTQFSDGRLRGNPGWSSLFSEDIIVFRSYIQRAKISELRQIIDGKFPFEAVNPTSPQGQTIDRMARIAREFIIKSVGDKPPELLAKLEEEAIRFHETEHEVRRRILGLKEGDRVYGGLEEEAAELKSIIRLSDMGIQDWADKSWDILAHIIELAAGNSQFAWSVLGRLTDRTTQAGILDRLEELAADETGLSWLDQQALIAHAQVDAEWAQIYAQARDGQIFDPYTGPLAYNTKFDTESVDMVPLEVDQAMPASADKKTAPVGGIDLASGHLEINTVGNGIDRYVSFNPASLGSLPINGFTFDLNISPLTDLSLLISQSPSVLVRN